MRHFFITLLATLLLTGGIVGIGAPVVHAQAATSVTNSSPAAAATPATLDANTNASYDFVMVRIMGLFAWLVGVSAITLDNAVYYTVVDMGTYVKQLTAVGVAWRILRDLANILLIFGFLGAGIATILNVDKYGFGSKMLPKLLIAAVLINFSLFISEAMVDATNLFATEVYTQINGGNLAGAKNFDNITKAADDGVASKIMGQVGLQTIYGNAVTNTAVFKGGYTWFIGFMAILLFLITAFVMFSLSFILIARFVVLIFLILLSPIAFAGWAIPSLNYRMEQWWKNFTEQIITAPVLLILLYVALTVITDAQFLTGFGGKHDWTGWISGSSGGITGFAGMMLSFLVAMGLLLVVVIKAKSMSAVGANFATKWAGRATFGATAYGASTLFGGSANVARRTLQRYAPNSKFTRGASRILRTAEHARMDVRAIPGIGAGMAHAGAGGPVAKSAVDRGRQARDWRTGNKQASDRQYNQETRIPRLKAAIASANAGEVSKIMRSLNEQELQSDDVQNLITSNPIVVQALTNNQASQLSDKVLMQPSVHANMSIPQLESIRRAGMMTSANARVIGLASLTGALGTPAPTGTVHPTFATWFAGRTPQQQADIKAFWGF